MPRKHTYSFLTDNELDEDQSSEGGDDDVVSLDESLASKSPPDHHPVGTPVEPEPVEEAAEECLVPPDDDPLSEWGLSIQDKKPKKKAKKKVPSDWEGWD